MKEGGGREKSKNAEQEELRRASKSVPFIRGLRGHSALYIPFYRLFLLFTSPPSPACQSFLLPFPRFSIFPVFGSALHRAACSCRLCFIIPQLFRIHATPLQSLHCHPLSSLRSSHTHTHTHTCCPSRRYHAAFCKIYVCRRAGDVAAGYLFFQ